MATIAKRISDRMLITMPAMARPLPTCLTRATQPKTIDRMAVMRPVKQTKTRNGLATPRTSEAVARPLPGGGCWYPPYGDGWAP